MGLKNPILIIKAPILLISRKETSVKPGKKNSQQQELHTDGPTPGLKIGLVLAMHRNALKTSKYEAKAPAIPKPP